MKKSTITGLSALPLALASSACASPAAGAQESRQQPAQQPNVVYIMTDQQSYYMISEITKNLGKDPYANNTYFQTPNIDRLVRSGYTFSNCYAANPVSGPSRFALLTGESPNAHGMTGNFSPGGKNGERIMSVITSRAMGTLFRGAGYRTYYGGKVHLPWADGRGGNHSIYDAPNAYGFDEYLCTDDRNVLARTGVEFINNYKEKEPFLLFLSFINPHDICASTFFFSDKAAEGFDEESQPARENQVRYREMYKRMNPALFKGEQLAKAPLNAERTDRYPVINFKGPKITPDQFKVLNWLYYRLTEQVDAEIGQVLDALEKSPYKNNTLIVFTSDHGEMGGSHHLSGKNIPYQECQRVPLIFVGKGIPKGRIDNTTPVCNGWDMLPTMLDLAGVEVPSELLGKSLKGKVIQDKALDRKYLFFESANSFGVLDGGRYKYYRMVPNSTYAIEGGDEVLFDLKSDPGELHNLAYDNGMSYKLSELRAALKVEMDLRGVTFEAITKNVAATGNAAKSPTAPKTAKKK